MNKTMAEDLIQMLDLEETIDQLARGNSVRWYGHVLRMDKNHILREALDPRVMGTRKRVECSQPGYKQ